MKIFARLLSKCRICPERMPSNSKGAGCRNSRPIAASSVPLFSLKKSQRSPDLLPRRRLKTRDHKGRISKKTSRIAQREDDEIEFLESKLHLKTGQSRSRTFEDDGLASLLDGFSDASAKDDVSPKSGEHEEDSAPPRKRVRMAHGDGALIAMASLSQCMVSADSSIYRAYQVLRAVATLQVLATATTRVRVALNQKMLPLTLNTTETLLPSTAQAMFRQLEDQSARSPE